MIHTRWVGRDFHKMLYSTDQFCALGVVFQSNLSRTRTLVKSKRVGEWQAGADTGLIASMQGPIHTLSSPLASGGGSPQTWTGMALAMELI